MEEVAWQCSLRGMRGGMRGVIRQMMEEVRMAVQPEGYEGGGVREGHQAGDGGGMRHEGRCGTGRGVGAQPYPAGTNTLPWSAVPG